MSTIDVLTSAVIALESFNIPLLTLLLVTPVPKHSMVKALIISCLLRSILDILLPVVYKVAPDQLGPDLDHHQGTVNACVSESILTRYLTVVKAAFAVSFTLPCLSLTLLQVKPKRSADDYPRLTRRSVLILCSAPFAWALPVLITPIPHVVQGASVVFNITSCYFDDAAFTIVSLAFTLIPLGIAVIISTIMGVVVWRYSDTILENAGWLFVRSKRFARFASLVFVTMISATLYTVLLSLWLHARLAEPQTSDDDGQKWREHHPVLTKVTRTSVLWEAITPLLFFFIFAAQEEIYETWLGWLCRLVPLRGDQVDARFRVAAGFHRSHHITQGTCSAQTQTTQGVVVREMGRSTPSSFKLPRIQFPGKILARPMSPANLTANSLHEDRRKHTGLNPPPRLGSEMQGTEQQRRAPSRFRLPFQGPSMTTFGSQPSMSSHRNGSSMGDIQSNEGAASTITDAQYESVSRDYARPETPGSARTFGRYKR